MKNINKQNSVISYLLFVLFCFGLLGFCWLLGFLCVSELASKNIPLAENSSNFYSIIVVVGLLIFCLCTTFLWLIFGNLIRNLNSISSFFWIVLVFILTIKHAYLYFNEYGKSAFFVKDMVFFTNLWLFLPFYLIFMAQQNMSYMFFRKYFLLLFLFLPDIIFSGASLHYFRREEYQYNSLIYVFLSFILYVLFFKYFPRVMNDFKYCINWGEMTWWKWTILTVPAILIGLPCFILFYVFF
jgi:hypothetical protein